MNRMLKQFIRFILISGTGWLIDVGVYSILALVFNLKVFFSNLAGSILAITFVFYVSTKKIFDSNKKNFPLVIKYIIYFMYQLILIILVSIIMQKLYFISGNYFQINANHLKIILKIFVTPFTMVLNFFVLKFLSERL